MGTSRKTRHRRVVYRKSKTSSKERTRPVLDLVAKAAVLPAAVVVGVTDPIIGAPPNISPRSHNLRWFLILIVIVLAIVVGVFASDPASKDGGGGGGGGGGGSTRSFTQGVTLPATRDFTRPETDRIATPIAGPDLRRRNAVEIGMYVLFSLTALFGVLAIAASIRFAVVGGGEKHELKPEDYDWIKHNI